MKHRKNATGRWEIHGSHLGKCATFFLLSDAAAEGGRGESTKASPSCLMMFIIIVSQRHAIFAFLAQNIKFIMMIRDWNPRMLPTAVVLRWIFPQKNSICQYFSAISSISEGWLALTRWSYDKFMSMIYGKKENLKWDLGKICSVDCFGWWKLKRAKKNSWGSTYELVSVFISVF
jgi:hypothetical protein